MADKYAIRHDYHAVHSSGTVPASAKKLIVCHDIESAGLTTAAEGAGRWFASSASAGSTQYGVDNDSIQQYLPDLAVPWGAPYANRQGIHIEMMGLARWTPEQWRKNAAGTIDRTAWLIARLSRRYGIPIRKLTDSQVRNGAEGVTTHRQCTRAWNVRGGHTDPGSGFPWDELLERARAYLQGEKVDVVKLKKAMLAYAQAAKPPIAVPPGFLLNGNWGESARTLAWRVSGRVHETDKSVPQSAKPTGELYSALAP